TIPAGSHPRSGPALATDGFTGSFAKSLWVTMITTGSGADSPAGAAPELPRGAESSGWRHLKPLLESVPVFVSRVIDSYVTSPGLPREPDPGTARISPELML